MEVIDMKQKSITAFLGILLMILPLLTVTPTLPAKSAPKLIEIELWYTENDAEKPGVLQLVAEFEAANPDVDVKEVQKGFFDARQLYQSAFIAAEEPEVFRAARDWVIEFAQADMLLPLDEYFDAGDLEDFIPNALRLIRYTGSDGFPHYWGFPQVVDAPALFYNKYLFEQAGINTSAINVDTSWTWTEFKQYCADLTDTSDQNNRKYGFTMAGMFFGAQGVYFGNGGQIFEGNAVCVGDIAINTEGSKQAFGEVKEIVDAAYTPAWDLQGWGTLNAYFANPSTVQVAMIQQGPWQLRDFLENSIEFNDSVEGAKPYASLDNLGIMQLPHDADGNQGAPLGGHAYIVSKYAEASKVEAAVKLAKFMTSTDAMKLRSKEYYLVPARQSAFDAADVQASDAWDYLQVFKKMTDVATQVPVSHYWARLETDLANELDLYLAGDNTLDQFLESTITLWKEYIPMTCPIITTSTESTSGTGTITETESETSTTTATTTSEEYSPGFEWVIFAITMLTIGQMYRLRKRKTTK